MKKVVKKIINISANTCSIVLAVWSVFSDVEPNWVRIIGVWYILVFFLAIGFVLGSRGDELDDFSEK